MRCTPMSVSEQCTLEREMLLHFKLAAERRHENYHANGEITSSKVFSIHDANGAGKAIEISQMFFSLAETTDAPIDCEEMVLAIRYRMGYSWIAWFFFKNFAIPIIKYLWKRYHNPDPVGSPVVAQPEHKMGDE